MDIIGNLPSMPLPTLPPTPSPEQLNCTFELNGVKIDLKDLPGGEFNLTDWMNDKYIATAPCKGAQGTNSPALETWWVQFALQSPLLSPLCRLAP
jgi:hypothetical protein